MPTWLIVVLAVLLVLAVGGALARRAQLARTRAAFEASLERANRDLATAAAADRGWDRATLEAAARRICAEQLGAEPDGLHLVEVLDRPGTDEDRAVFHAQVGGRTQPLTLGRRGGEWVAD
jgi:ADP-ribose pyrophosphatase YjhB (NUDIX family)